MSAACRACERSRCIRASPARSGQRQLLLPSCLHVWHAGKVAGRGLHTLVHPVLPAERVLLPCGAHLNLCVMQTSAQAHAHAHRFLCQGTWVTRVLWLRLCLAPAGAVGHMLLCKELSRAVWS